VSPRVSERIGAVKVDIQVGTVNPALRNTIWNFIAEELLPLYDWVQYQPAFELITEEVLRLPTERIDRGSPRYWLLAQVEKMQWTEVYDLLEFCVGMAGAWHRMSVNAAVKRANMLLQREHSGYRFVNGELAPITNASEISEIEQAAERAAAAALDGVREQIGQAVRLLGQRPQPDYRNAVKEAISAVEGGMSRSLLNLRSE
jgi:hypothetical protein